MTLTSASLSLYVYLEWTPSSISSLRRVRVAISSRRTWAALIVNWRSIPAIFTFLATAITALYFDVAPPFGLRSSAMICQRTTSAVTYMFQKMGFQCTNYIDDFGGAELPAHSCAAFNASPPWVVSHPPTKTVLPPPVWSSSVFNLTPSRWQCPSLLIAFKSSFTVALLYSSSHISLAPTYSPFLVSCPSLPPVFAPPAFSCQPSLTRFTSIGNVPSVSYLTITNTIYAGDVISFPISTVSLLSRLPPGSAIPSTSPPTLATLALAVILMVSFSIPLFRRQSSTVLVMISTPWSSSPSCWLSSSGALLCVDYGLFFTATIATAFRHWIWVVPEPSACNCVYVKFGSSPPFTILICLPFTFPVVKTLSLITLAVGTYLLITRPNFTRWPIIFQPPMWLVQCDFLTLRSRFNAFSFTSQMSSRLLYQSYPRNCPLLHCNNLSHRYKPTPMPPALYAICIRSGNRFYTFAVLIAWYLSQPHRTPSRPTLPI